MSRRPVPAWLALKRAVHCTGAWEWSPPRPSYAGGVDFRSSPPIASRACAAPNPAPSRGIAGAVMGGAFFAASLSMMFRRAGMEMVASLAFGVALAAAAAATLLAAYREGI